MYGENLPFQGRHISESTNIRRKRSFSENLYVENILGKKSKSIVTRRLVQGERA